MMGRNQDKLEEYVNYLHGDGDAIIMHEDVPQVVSTRACIHCGKPYQINIPYELCVPGVRDLCDDCLIKGVPLP
ncbi:MAG: hypothetical protein ABR999_09000 [Methanoregula sp.]|jgi:hypothetical protein|uniref:hypothetical protein n=1 Tax=Methanoregula sp. TaxID=2052170 RepID=UPI003D0D178C